MFLDDDRIEQKVRMKDKDKYKSILVWLMDNVDNNETDFNGMITRAVGLFGSILGCIKTTKKVENIIMKLCLMIGNQNINHQLIATRACYIF